jgi:hypothetical protein
MLKTAIRHWKSRVDLGQAPLDFHHVLGKTGEIVPAKHSLGALYTRRLADAKQGKGKAQRKPITQTKKTGGPKVSVTPRLTPRVKSVRDGHMQFILIINLTFPQAESSSSAEESSSDESESSDRTTSEENFASKVDEIESSSPDAGPSKSHHSPPTPRFTAPCEVSTSRSERLRYLGDLSFETEYQEAIAAISQLSVRTLLPFFSQKQ